MWELYRFNFVLKGTWKIIEEGPFNNYEALANFLRRELVINNIDDWYTVSWEQVNNFVPLSLFKNGMFGFLTKAYPDHEWDHSRFINFWKDKEPRHSLLVRTLHNLFPSGIRIYENYILEKSKTEMKDPSINLLH